MSKDTSKPSTTIEAQIDDIFEEYGLGNTTLASEKGIVAARSKLLKAFEAEKLKGQISELERLYMIARRGDHYSQAIQERTKSLQQQLEELPF